MGIIVYNGEPSTNYYLHVEHPPVYTFAERNYEVTHVPGRNGDLVFDQGSYNNVDTSYEVSVGSLDKFLPDLARGVSEWLHAPTGYARLEDSYTPQFYRLGMYTESASFTNELMHAGRSTITFNCKPQRFLKDGEKEIELPIAYGREASATIINPTNFTAIPEIIFGSNAISDWNVYITITNALGTVRYHFQGAVSRSGDICIDGELMQCYMLGGGNYNTRLTLTDGVFAKFPPGETTVKIAYLGDAPIQRAKVIPRWWTL